MLPVSITGNQHKVDYLAYALNIALEDDVETDNKIRDFDSLRSFLENITRQSSRAQ